MSRPLRIQFENAWYHVMNRGRRGEKIFQDKEDFIIFIELLEELNEVFRINVASYCLMTNHYHLLVQTPDANLSRSIRHLNGVYTQKYNKRHNYAGPLYRGRYKSIVIDSDSYALELVRYIHRNPLEAGIVDDINKYQWSTHKAYLSSAEKWKWLHKEEFRITKYSTVSSIVEKVKKNMGYDKSLKKRVILLIEKITKGQ